jgi:hypothetical protein
MAVEGRDENRKWFQCRNYYTRIGSDKLIHLRTHRKDTGGERSKRNLKERYEGDSNNFIFGTSF